MTTRRIVAPATLPITLADVRAHLRADPNDTSEDDYINSLMAAAVAFVDGDGMLGRAMITQTWAEYVSQSPGWVRLGMGPFIALVSVQYYDDAGALQTATLGDFETRLQDDFVICKPKENREWPTADVRADAIKITYTAGFGAAADVPAGIKHALMLIVAHWYQNREAATEAGMHNLPMAVDALIGNERVRWFG